VNPFHSGASFRDRRDNLKAPGWQRVVAELTTFSDDDRDFHTRLARVLAQVAAARQACLLFPDHTDGEQIEPRVEFVWPPAATPAPDGAAGALRPTNDEVESRKDVLAAGRAAFESGQARAFSLDSQQELYYSGSGGGTPSAGFVLAIPLPSVVVGGAQASAAGTPPPAAVVTLLTEARSPEAIRSTLAMAEVIAGYTHAHGARQALRRNQSASAALDLAARLVAAINSAPNFRGSCFQLVNDLARQEGFKAERVALGWVHDDKTKVIALSDVEHFDRRTAMVMKIARAMDECLDQEQPIVVPVPPPEGEGSDIVLSQAIVHAHRELAASQPGLRIVSAPLRVDENVVGVVTMELAGGPNAGQINLQSVELLQRRWT